MMAASRGDARRLDGRDGLALAGLALFCLALLWQIVFAGRILSGPDAFSYFYPLYEYASARLLAGELPLWNPYLFMGAPFLANSQAGVLYPLHWPLLALSAPSLASATLVIHYVLLCASTYLLLRVERGNTRLAAAVGAVAMVAGGLVGSQAEHLNQVESLAWLPLQAILLGRALAGTTTVSWWRSVRPPLRLMPAAAVVACVQILAGHVQAAFICQVCLLVYAAGQALAATGSRHERLRSLMRGLVFVSTTAALGALMAAAQLLPTLELSGLSVRSGGLSYREAIAFSLAPRAWLLGFLPHYGSEEPFGEYTAWIGVAGLLLAACGLLSGRRRYVPAVLGGVGLFLALGGYNPLYYLIYRLVPGFGLFRVPARWLALYAMAASMLVADGIDALPGLRLQLGQMRHHRPLLAAAVATAGGLWVVADPRPEARTLLAWLVVAVAALLLAFVARPRLRRYALAAIVVVELTAASSALPYNEGTAAQVWSASRRSYQAMGDTGLYRFLTISSGEFDTGDMGDLAATLGQTLGPAGRYQLLVTSKLQELLARDLALHWRRFAVDGYDGGVLPTRDFVAFETLFVGDEASNDGRLSEALSTVPARTLLALANVRYVVMDRVDDIWLEGVYYDLGLPLALAADAEAEIAVRERFPADAVGLVLSAGAGGSDGEVLRVSLGGAAEYVLWRHGEDIDARDDGGAVLPATELEGRPGLYYLRLPLPETTYVEALRFAAGESGSVTVAAVSLTNSTAGTGTAVPLDAELVPLHYGDVKVYEFGGTLPRAYLARCVEHVQSADEALARLAGPGFDPRDTTIVVGDGADSCRTAEALGDASVVEYAPERVSISVNTLSASYLVLLDSYFPGWSAEVDGWPSPVLRANYAFRAVMVPAGRHQVTFTYHSRWLGAGVAVSLVGWCVWLGLVAANLMAAGRVHSR